MGRDGAGCDHADITSTRKKLESHPPEAFELLLGKFSHLGRREELERRGRPNRPSERGQKPLNPCWDNPQSFTKSFRRC